jgi:2-polyprenyl-3-methyl-5-hydroxy-6-metoxy-1,4-benzoquinol methylase
MLTRKQVPEMMDHPVLNPLAHKKARDGLARLNSFGSGINLILYPLLMLMREQNLASLRVLDLATGSGEVAINIWSAFRERQKDLHMAGCDISRDAIEMAKENASKAGATIDFFTANVLEDELPDDYDVIMTTLFTHHLSEEDVVNLMSRMKSATRKMVLISDLERSVINYGLVWLATRLVTDSPIVHFDGPASVLNSFTRGELLQLSAKAGLDGATVRMTPPCRMILTWKK